MHDNLLELSSMVAYIKELAPPNEVSKKIVAAAHKNSVEASAAQDAWMFADQPGFIAMQHMGEQCAVFADRIKNGNLNHAGCDQLSLTCLGAKCVGP